MPAKMRALIVDDDKVRGKAIADGLSDYMTSVVVVTALPAIKAVRTRRFDVIFMDHDLGEQMTGVDVAACMYFSTNRFTPTIIHSANPVGAANVDSMINSFGGKPMVLSFTTENFFEKVLGILRGENHA